MKKNYATFKPARVFTRGGDLTKEWFVEYSIYIPETDCFKRFRETNGANRIMNGLLRLQALETHALAVNQRLILGWNPISKSYKKDIVWDENSWETCVQIILTDKKQSSSVSNYKQYKYILEFFTDFLRRRRLNNSHPKEITKAVIMDYLAWRLDTCEIRRGTRDKDLIILSGSFKVLKLRGVIKENPCMDIPRLGDRPERHMPYTAGELKQLLNYLYDHDKRMLHFCVFVMSAIRPSEILRLQVRDIDLHSGTVIIQNTKSKNAHSRIARIPKVLLTYLKDLKLKGFPATYYVFNPSGMPQQLMHFNKWFWGKLFNKYKMELRMRSEITMYSLKHTILIEMCKNRASMDELMSFGGFKTLDALQAYLKSHINHTPDDPSDKLRGLFE